MAAAPSRVQLDFADKPPKHFCSKEDKAEEPRALSEAALSSIPGTGWTSAAQITGAECPWDVPGAAHCSRQKHLPGQELRAGPPDVQPLLACAWSCLIRNIFRMIPLPW